MGKPTRVEGLEGNVLKAPFASGSKSAHVAVWLDTGEHRWVLRRKDGPAMGDAALIAFIGQRVRCDGVIVAHTLLAESIEIIDTA